LHGILLILAAISLHVLFQKIHLIVWRRCRRAAADATPEVDGSDAVLQALGDLDGCCLPSLLMQVNAGVACLYRCACGN
jgi:hypothetical protein